MQSVRTCPRRGATVPTVVLRNWHNADMSITELANSVMLVACVICPAA